MIRELAFKEGIREALERNEYYGHQQSHDLFQFLTSLSLSFPEFSRQNIYLLLYVSHELNKFHMKKYPK